MTGTSTALLLRLELPDLRTSPRLARHALAGALGGVVGEDCLDAAVLLVSELVTNVLLHASGGVELVVRLDPAWLRVEVCDHSPLMPTVRGCDLESTHGRGVLLVERMATRWGADPTPTGKCVWFELAVHADAPHEQRRLDPGYAENPRGMLDLAALDLR